jgi:DNA-binding winged helix-turn-helix (wHTH) protein/Flp pilus assembly protein TadD
VYRFGPFEFDPATRRLYHGSTVVRLPEPQSAMVRTFIAQAGQVVSQDTLIQAAWGSVAVNSDSVRQSICRLRKTFSVAGGIVFIETVPNRGYRFAAALQSGERYDSAPPDGVVLAAHQAFRRGRADFLTLKLDRILSACKEFEQALALKPDYVEAHIGLANACALIFEASRADAQSDLRSLQRAIHHARHATVLSALSGDAWSTLAFVQGLQGDAEPAALAACRAIELEPHEWLHRLRLAYISWGDERVRAARAVLKENPGLALAYWLVATVLVARGALAAALDVLTDGCRAQDQQSLTTGSFPAVGLHLLRGLVLAGLHRVDEAVEEFQRELSFVTSGQLYARECASNTWYALGAIHLRQRRRDDAHAAFRNALDAASGNWRTLAALGRPIPVPPTGDRRAVYAAIARAIVLARAGRHADAAIAYRHAISTAPPGAGWILPVEPLINVDAHPDIWSDVLAMVRQRAV